MARVGLMHCLLESLEACSRAGQMISDIPQLIACCQEYRAHTDPGKDTFLGFVPEPQGTYTFSHWSAWPVPIKAAHCWRFVVNDKRRPHLLGR
eukprot:7230121-Prorocentrum_lima.AAC.1